MLLMQPHAQKGLAFNAKQNQTAYKLIAKAKASKLFDSLSKDAKMIPYMMEFFQTHTDRNINIDARKYSESKTNKYLNSDMLFKWMRDGEIAIDTHLTVAMSMNYGFNKEGTFSRIKNPDNTVRVGYENYTSIFDILKEDFEKGSEFFKSLPTKDLMKFRQAVMEQSKKIKGTMTYDDKAYFQTQLITELLMTFKTWMPGVIGDRFGKLKFNEKLDGADWGRYSSLVGSNAYLAGDTLSGFLKEVVLPSIAKFTAETLTFGYLYNTEKWKPLNEKRLKAIYNKKLETSKDTFIRKDEDGETVLISFEDFKQIVIQNQKATQSELRYLLGIVLVLMSMSLITGDDDEPMYKNSWEGRTAYRIISRVYTELAFLYSPEEYLRLLGSSIPLIGLLKDIYALLENTVDETRDLLVGENNKRDQSPIGYRSLKMVKGMNALIKLAELFPNDVKKDR